MIHIKMSLKLNQQITKFRNNIKRLERVIREYDQNLDVACVKAKERAACQHAMEEPCYVCHPEAACDNHYDEEAADRRIEKEYEQMKIEKKTMDIPDLKKQLARNKRNLAKAYSKRRNMTSAEKKKLKDKTEKAAFAASLDALRHKCK